MDGSQFEANQLSDLGNEVHVPTMRGRHIYSVKTGHEGHEEQWLLEYLGFEK